MSEEVVIKVEGISKTFKIPHERHTSLKSAALGMFREKKYTPFEAVKTVSFEVKKGEFFGIVGRNGSGKSTLLKMLAGIYSPDLGRIIINGKLSPFLELGVGFNPELTARENIYLGGAVLGLNRKEINSKFDEIIKFAELEEFVDMKFKNFSSGMQVRLAFALSINAHAEIILVDEVLAVGDTAFQKKCFDEFRKMKSSGKTVVYVSHSMSTVREFCDRAVLINKGENLLIGSPEEVSDLYNRLNIASAGLSKSVSGHRKKDISIKEVLINNGKVDIESGETLTINTLFVSDKKVVPGNYIFGFGIYDYKNNLVLADSKKMTNRDIKNGIFFSIKLPKLTSGEYRISLNISNLRSNLLSDFHDKKYLINIKNIVKEFPAIIRNESCFYPKGAIIGLTRVRNESLVLKDTLNHMSKIVDYIVAYDDDSTDETLDILYGHDKVIKVIENKTWSNNRVAAETQSRNALLEAAMQFEPKWLFYFDADERFEGDIRTFLKGKESDGVDGVRIKLFDAYITGGDKAPYKGGELFNFRKLFGPEGRNILMIWRNNKSVKFVGDDAREPRVAGNIIIKFYCQHYGKSISIAQWDQTCDYYSTYFPEPYLTKWSQRKGHAVHDISDFGGELEGWERVKNSKAVL